MSVVTLSLASFAAKLRFVDIPAPVLRRAEDLMLDWFASTLAGKGARPVETIARFMQRMGPADGPSEVLIHRGRTSPLIAAVTNAAAAHFAEQDDVHNGSVFHPAAVVFPPAPAVAQALGCSGAELLTAVAADLERNQGKRRTRVWQRARRRPADYRIAKAGEYLGR